MVIFVLIKRANQSRCTLHPAIPYFGSLSSSNNCLMSNWTSWTLPLLWVHRHHLTQPRVTLLLLQWYHLPAADRRQNIATTKTDQTPHQEIIRHAFFSFEFTLHYVLLPIIPIQLFSLTADTFLAYNADLRPLNNRWSIRVTMSNKQRHTTLGYNL